MPRRATTPEAREDSDADLSFDADPTPRSRRRRGSLVAQGAAAISAASPLQAGESSSPPRMHQRDDVCLGSPILRGRVVRWSLLAIIRSLATRKSPTATRLPLIALMLGLWSMAYLWWLATGNGPAAKTWTGHGSGEPPGRSRVVRSHAPTLSSQPRRRRDPVPLLAGSGSAPGDLRTPTAVPRRDGGALSSGRARLIPPRSATIRP